MRASTPVAAADRVLSEARPGQWAVPPEFLRWAEAAGSIAPCRFQVTSQVKLQRVLIGTGFGCLPATGSSRCEQQWQKTPPRQRTC